MLIWGWTRKIHQLAMLTLVCANCHNPSAHALRKAVTMFTLFFIPIIPLKTRHFLECTFCGAAFEVPKENVHALIGQAYGVDQQDAGQQQTQQRERH